MPLTVYAHLRAILTADSVASEPLIIEVIISYPNFWSWGQQDMSPWPQEGRIVCGAYLAQTICELRVQRMNPGGIDEGRGLNLLNSGRDDLGVCMAHVHHRKHRDEVEVLIAIRILNFATLCLGNDHLFCAS
jgi:hypothetical protein